MYLSCHSAARAAINSVFLHHAVLGGVPALNARLCLLPRRAIAIKGDWNVAGLVATGSHSIGIDNVFVPEHRTLLIADAIEAAAPGQKIHRAPLFRSTYYSFLVTALAGPAPGVAQGALDSFLERIHQRVVAPMNIVQSKLIRTHRQIAEAGARKIRPSLDRIGARGSGLRGRRRRHAGFLSAPHASGCRHARRRSRHGHALLAAQRTRLCGA